MAGLTQSNLACWRHLVFSKNECELSRLSAEVLAILEIGGGCKKKKSDEFNHITGGYDDLKSTFGFQMEALTLQYNGEN